MKGKLVLTIGRVMELLAPLECVGCGGDGAVFCAVCLGLASEGVPEVCYSCGLSSAYGATCESCEAQTDLSGVTVGARYEAGNKELILRLKFHRLRRAARDGAALVAARAEAWPPGAVITSVPIAAARYRERGYNQSELVAREVARQLGLPYQTMLRRTTATHQIGLDRRTRLEQIAGAFYAPAPVRAQAVVIVDDVVTTGATLSECASVLSAAGAGEVWGAAIARH